MKLLFTALAICGGFSPLAPSLLASDIPPEEIAALFADTPEIPSAETPLPSPTDSPPASLVSTADEVGDFEARRDLARVLAATPGRSAEAIEIYRAILPAAHGPEKISLLRELAPLLLAAQRHGSAADTYAQLEAAGLTSQERQAYAAALARLGQNQRAADVLQPSLQQNLTDGKTLDFWVHLHRQAGSLSAAVEYLRQAAAAAHSGHRTSLQERLYTLGLETGDAALAQDALRELLTAEPRKARWWRELGGLQMAQRDFPAAARSFSHSLELDASNADARRQLFRIQNILGRDREAAAVLQPLFAQPADELLRQRLRQSSATSQQASLMEWLDQRESLSAREGPTALYEALEMALTSGELAQSVRGEARAQTFLALHTLRPVASVQSAAWKEQQAAEAARHGRNIEATRLYRRLSEQEPENLSALYGLAGALQSAGNLEEARAVYESLVRLNPQDPIASGALRRAADLLRDTLRLYGTIENEDSPGRLANITSTRMGLRFSTRFNEHFSAQLAPLLFLEAPKGGPLYTAQGFAVGVTYRHNEFASLNLGFGYRAYNQREAQNTFTGSAELVLTPTDRVRIGLAYLREDVLRNQFNILQGTQANVLQASLHLGLTDNLELTTVGRALLFSDQNTQGQITAAAAYTLLRKPGLLRAQLGGTGIWTARQSQEIYHRDRLVDVIYPYWTPGQYGQGFATLTWSQNLSPEAYTGQNELSYSASFLTSLDTSANFLVGGELSLRWEVVRNLILEAAASIQRSQQWNSARGTLSADYRF